MNTGFTAVIKQDGDWWIGWIGEIAGVNAQERTRDALLESLGEALRDIVELNPQQARDEMAGNYEEVAISAGSAKPSRGI